MTFTTAPHLYIQSDLPADMTLAEWRRARHTGRTRPGLVRRALGLGAAT
jgi:hypothetical protein